MKSQVTSTVFNGNGLAFAAHVWQCSLHWRLARQLSWHPLLVDSRQGHYFTLEIGHFDSCQGLALLVFQIVFIALMEKLMVFFSDSVNH